MKKIFTPLLFLSVTAFGQSTLQGTSANSVNNDWKTVVYENYSIQYPLTWELNQSGQMGTSLILLSSQESEQDKFRENVNLIIQDLTGKNIDLNKYTEISEGQIKTMVTNGKTIETKRIKNGSGEYHKIIYTGDQGTFQLKFEQYYFVVNAKAYVLTFSSEQSKFDAFQETGEKIMNSFILKNK